MMLTANKVLSLAKSQIGVKATDIKRCKYNKWYYGYDVSGSAYDWCVVFLQWIFSQLGESDLLYTKTANVGALALAFKNKGRLVTSNYKPGDLVVFSWSSTPSSWISGVNSLDHIGIIEQVNSDGTYTTIEGNTGSSVNGEVQRRTRYKSQISCCLRPVYSGTSSDSISDKITSEVQTVQITMQKIYKSNKSNRKGQVMTLQRILNELKDGKGYRGKDDKKLTVDGDFGTNTEYALKAYQKAHKLTVDGICGKNSWSALLCEVPN